MITWIILRGLFLSTDNEPTTLAIRQYEMRHAPFWTSLTARARWIGLRLLLAALGIALVSRSTPATQALWLGVFCVMASSLILLFPSLFYLLPPLAGTLAPVIAREREQGNWEMLRMMPIPLPDLILLKAGGALGWMQNQLLNTLSMLIPVALSTGALGLILSLHGLNQRGEWLLALGAGGLCALMYYADRIQQFTLMVISTLGVSASTRSSSETLTRALIFTGLVWAIDVGAAAVLLLVQPGRLIWPLNLHILVLILLGPLVAYLIELPVQSALLYTFLTLIVREIAVTLGWYVVLHAARVVQG